MSSGTWGLARKRGGGSCEGGCRVVTTDRSTPITQLRPPITWVYIHKLLELLNHILVMITEETTVIPERDVAKHV